MTAHGRGKRVIREPKSPILDAEFAADEAKRVFGLWLDAARELRDYLALAAQRFHGAANGDVLDFALLGSQYRNALIAYDGVVTCLEVGAAEVAMLPARTLFESRLYIGRILHPKTEEDRAYRADAFHVRSLREGRYWALCEIPGTPEYLQDWAASDPQPRFLPR